MFSNDVSKVGILQRQITGKIAAFTQSKNSNILVEVAQLQDQIIAILIGLLKGDHSGSELSMIEMQNVINQRNLAMQMTTNIVNATREAGQSLARNIR